MDFTNKFIKRTINTHEEDRNSELEPEGFDESFEETRTGKRESIKKRELEKFMFVKMRQKKEIKKEEIEQRAIPKPFLRRTIFGASLFPSKEKICPMHTL